MTDRNVYEVNVQVSGGGQYFQVEHRFPTLPEVATLVALKDEAADAFLALFDEDVDEVGVHVIYLPTDERGDDGRDRERAPAR